MNSKQLALLSGASCIVVLATYAWAASQDAITVKTEDVAAEVAVKVEESADPALLCTPMADANEATEAPSASDEAKADDKAEAKTEGVTEGAAEVALPVCDEDGNPPAPESDVAVDEEKTEEAAAEPAEEPAKTE